MRRFKNNYFHPACSNYRIELSNQCIFNVYLIYQHLGATLCPYQIGIFKRLFSQTCHCRLSTDRYPMMDKYFHLDINYRVQKLQARVYEAQSPCANVFFVVSGCVSCVTSESKYPMCSVSILHTLYCGIIQIYRSPNVTRGLASMENVNIIAMQEHQQTRTIISQK